MKTVTAIRRKLGMTQVALAAAMGCSQSLVSGYENGSWVISPENAKTLREVARGRGLALTLDQIYGLEPLESDGSTSPAAA